MDNAERNPCVTAWSVFDRGNLPFGAIAFKLSHRSERRLPSIRGVTAILSISNSDQYAEYERIEANNSVKYLHLMITQQLRYYIGRDRRRCRNATWEWKFERGNEISLQLYDAGRPES